MTDTLPAPLVPAEVDLRDFGFMPLDVTRLMRSSTWRKARRHPELGYYMVNLWASSWHEVPCASLPDDDDELADFARCEPKTWDKVKDRVLAGWVKCSDGRIYHPVVAEKALEAWGKQSAQKQRTKAARAAALKRHKGGNNGDTDGLTDPVAGSVTEDVTASKGQERDRDRDRDRDRKGIHALTGSPPDAARAPGPASGDLRSGDEEPDVGVIPAFLDRRPKSLLPADWQPTDQALQQITGSRPDIGPELLEQRIVEFRNHCRESGKQSFDFDAYFVNFMVKTNGQRPQHDGEERSLSAALAGYARPLAG